MRVQGAPTGRDSLPAGPEARAPRPVGLEEPVRICSRSGTPASSPRAEAGPGLAPCRATSAIICRGWVRSRCSPTTPIRLGTTRGHHGRERGCIGHGQTTGPARTGCSIRPLQALGFPALEGPCPTARLRLPPASSRWATAGTRRREPPDRNQPQRAGDTAPAEQPPRVPPSPAHQWAKRSS